MLFSRSTQARLPNYSYLADGTKISALDGGGEGLVYRGPFVYRRSTGSGTSSLTLESAAFSGGRLTPGGAMLYVTDYLGSVRAVVNGSNGAIYKASDFSTFGTEFEVASIQKLPAPLGTTFRDAYTGKEDQSLDFGTGYTDFGARQYSPALRRWMAPDPLSEKYYGISPYAFCNNNPLRYVDPDGKDGWDVFVGHSIGLITNVIPGTGNLRDLYSPADPIDYNLALRNSDLAAFKFGDFLTKAGAAEAAFGGAALAAGATSVSVSGGTLVLVGGPVAAIGAEEFVKGVVTAAGGSLMMMNSSKNQLDGYERGKPSNSNSDNKPKSINQLETDIKKGKAPKGFKHFHNMHTKGGQEHVHLEDGTSLNKDGSWKDGKNSQHKLTNKQIKYLQDNGWDI